MARRADIFRTLLPYINVGHYMEWNGFIIFGTPDVQELMDKIVGRPEGDDEARDILRTLISDAVVHGGRSKIAERLSLQPAPDFTSEPFKYFKYHSPDAIYKAIEILSNIEPELHKAAEVHGGKPDPVGEADSIEAALAEEILGKLREAVDRASTLDGMNLGRIPVEHLKRYFEEAHRCYLFGFNIACAVLCRAIVDTALQNVVDPQKLIKLRLKSLKSQDSYIAEMAIEAARGGILADDRPECVIAVRDAGNAAIHDYPEFERKWLPRLGEIVDQTRKILLDLYPSQV